MNNVAFLIPILIECPERERNLIDQLNYLLSFNANIFLFECDIEQKVPNIINNLIDKVNYKFIESSIFHRTWLLNQMALAAEKFSVIVLHDVDVFIPIQQLVDASWETLDRTFDFCFPYTIWRWVTQFTKPLLEETAETLVGSTGGSIFCRRLSFIEAGMENENCISWGMEDIERFNRWTILGYKIGRIDGCLYHADHPRNKNSGIENPYYEQNKLESDKVSNMSHIALKQYIKTWPWLLANFLPIRNNCRCCSNNDLAH
jgi:hypothetical protein